MSRNKCPECQSDLMHCHKEKCTSCPWQGRYAVTPTPDHGAAAAEICGTFTLGDILKNDDSMKQFYDSKVKEITEILASYYPAPANDLVEVLDQPEAHSREQREQSTDWRRDYAGGVLFAVTKLRTALTSAPVSKEREYRELLKECEWSKGYMVSHQYAIDGSCPVCDALQRYGHKDGCKLDAAIQEVENDSRT